jgi:hypothetical protein
MICLYKIVIFDEEKKFYNIDPRPDGGETVIPKPVKEYFTLVIILFL